MTIFNLFKIGIGPSSSHTVGPMLIAKQFCETVEQHGFLNNLTKIKIELFGSLGSTGIGHQSDVAVLLGLLGNHPKTVNIENVDSVLDDIQRTSTIKLLNKKQIKFSLKNDLILYQNKNLPFHPNAIKLTIYENSTELFDKTYYSIGGGEIICEDNIDDKQNDKIGRASCRERV